MKCVEPGFLADALVEGDGATQKQVNTWGHKKTQAYKNVLYCTSHQPNIKPVPRPTD
jgi:hypothetical protein